MTAPTSDAVDGGPRRPSDRLAGRLTSRLPSRLTGPLGRRLVSTVAVNVASIVVYLGASILVARSLGAEGRGAFAALMSLFLISLVLADLGQSSAVTYYAASQPRSLAATIGEGRRVMLLGGLGLTALGVVVATTVDLGLGLTPLELVLAVGASVVNALGAPYVFAAQAVAQRAWNLLRLVQPTLYTGLVAVAAALGVLDVRFLVEALVASCALTLVIAWLVARRLGITAGRAERVHAWRQRRYGLSAYAAGVPLALTQYGDKLVLAPLVGTAELGRYAVALSVVGLTAPLATAVASLRFPAMARLGDDHAARAAMARSTMRASVLVLGLGTVGACVVGHVLMPVVFGQDFADATWLLWAFAPTAFLRALLLIATGLLRGAGRPGVPARAQGVVLVVVAVGIVPSTLLAGLLGVAVVLAVAEALALALCWVALRAEGRVS